MRKIILAAPLLLMACATTPANQTAAIDVLVSGLTAADILALQYTSLPACPAATSVCADPATKASIKAAALTAYNAVTAAEASAKAGNTVDLTAATAALAVLQGMIPAPVKAP